jgi:hypothetical protein
MSFIPVTQNQSVDLDLFHPIDGFANCYCGRCLFQNLCSIGMSKALVYRKVKTFEKAAEFRVHTLRIADKIIVEVFDKSRRR